MADKVITIDVKWDNRNTLDRTSGYTQSEMITVLDSLLSNKDVRGIQITIEENTHEL